MHRWPAPFSRPCAVRRCLAALRAQEVSRLPVDRQHRRRGQCRLTDGPDPRHLRTAVPGQPTNYRDLQRAITRSVQDRAVRRRLVWTSGTPAGKWCWSFGSRSVRILTQWAVKGTSGCPSEPSRSGSSCSEGRPLDRAAVERGRAEHRFACTAPQGYYAARVKVIEIARSRPDRSGRL